MRTVRVLLVDDSDEFRQLLERLLLRLGFQIAGSVTSGEAALALMTSAQPDIVILDIAMPGLNGMEVVRRIRQNDTDVRLIILSMHGTPEYRQAAAAIGVDAYVVKDDLVPDLQNALRQLSGAAGKAVSS